MSDIHSSVKEYYGEKLSKTEDLLTNACTTSGAPPPHIRSILCKVHKEVKAKFYGCGLVVPELLDGCSVLDLGSGSGQDCYVISSLVGESGKVVGVDMTAEQVKVADKYIDYHREVFGFSKPNVEFKLGFIESLGELDIDDNSFDVIVSNCVINLCPDKAGVLHEAFRVLKPGGELYFSDVYCNRRLPAHIRRDPILHGECLAGAYYEREFLQQARAAGFPDPRLVSAAPIAPKSADIEGILAGFVFQSSTYRLIKPAAGASLDLEAEDYGQAIIYKGTIPRCTAEWKYDEEFTFATGKVTPVDGTTARLLSMTRYAPHLEIVGSGSVHYGPWRSAKDRQGETGAASVPTIGGKMSCSSGGGCC